ncbi:hypothetical protein EON82_05700 [bacterium]|nr:MAG: hypothetical protein EON82_05700 [bacterium]
MVLRKGCDPEELGKPSLLGLLFKGVWTQSEVPALIRKLHDGVEYGALMVIKDSIRPGEALPKLVPFP